jgi:hypothetical protein
MPVKSVTQYLTTNPLGNAQVGDYFVGNRVAGNTGGLVYAPKLNMDTTPGLAGNLTLNGFNIGPVTPTEIGYLSGVTSAIQTQINTKVTTNGALGTPTSGTLTNCAGLPIATGVSGLAAGVATFLTTPSSANLLAALTTKTGTGNAVFGTSPTFVTPLLGTPTSGIFTNCTGYTVANLSGLGTGVGTFLAAPSSANLASALTDKTGTGVNVFGTSPTLATPLISGITSGSGAASGNVGQIATNTYIVGTSISNNVITNVYSLNVAAGNYLLYGVFAAIPSAGATMTQIFLCLNTVNNTIPQPNSAASYGAAGLPYTSGVGVPAYIYTPGLYITLSGTTTYFLNALVAFSGGTCTYNSMMFAHRIS